jgi:hypothetical protein
LPEKVMGWKSEANALFSSIRIAYSMPKQKNMLYHGGFSKNVKRKSRFYNFCKHHNIASPAGKSRFSAIFFSLRPLS